MKYFKVKNQNDLQVTNPKTNWIFVNEELYTEREFEKLNVPEVLNFFNSKISRHDSIKRSDLFELVEVPKNKTYFFFGCRFDLDKSN